ncbi:MAG: hypothetical protein AAF821_07455 [Cyanobacteria bacterium P01_D01_bin.156]
MAEMFIGLGLSGLLIVMFGKSPSKSKPKPDNKATLTLVLNGQDYTVKEVKGASFEQH